MAWVWVEEHWEEVLPYSIASILLLTLILITFFFWMRGPVVEPVEVWRQPQVVVVEAPRERKEYEDSNVETRAEDDAEKGQKDAGV